MRCSASAQHDFLQQPIFAHYVAPENGALAHGGMAGQHFSGHALIAVHTVGSGKIEACRVAVLVTGAVKHEAVMVGSIDPGNAFGVGTVDVPHEAAALGVNPQVVGLRAVEPADQAVVACLRRPCGASSLK